MTNFNLKIFPSFIDRQMHVIYVSLNEWNYFGLFSHVV